MGGGVDSDTRLCQSVAQTEVIYVRRVNGTNQCVEIFFLENKKINFNFLTYLRKFFKHFAKNFYFLSYCNTNMEKSDH